jgi:hypothetical protein
MRARDNYERAVQHAVAQRLGLNDNVKRVFAESVGLHGREGELMALPLAQSGSDLMDGSGNLYFMPDFSPLDDPTFPIR